MILAIADDGTIGHAGGIPWTIPEDLKRFKALTTGHAVIMGRKTWESLPDKVRPLPDRRNIVVSRDANYRAPGASLWHSLETALHWARFGTVQDDPIGPFVIGGAEIYRESLPLATRIYMTRVRCSPGGDTRLDLDLAGWQATSREMIRGNAHPIAFDFITLERE